ncbi:MAG TPA: hypothetical protein VEB70_01720 [Noviherbaspirillum sp.]|nr:hypothetical protein [Noviherbaspirillum sp.]
MNKLTAAGATATGALIVIAVMMAMKGLPDAARAAAAAPAVPAQGHQAALQGEPAREIICPGCVLPADRIPQVPGSSPHRGAYASSGVSGNDPLEAMAYSSADSHALAPIASPTDRDGAPIARADTFIPSGSLVLAAAASHGPAGGTGTRHISVAGSGAAGSPDAPASGAGEGTVNDAAAADDPTATPEPPTVIAPVAAYCAGGVHCGERSPAPQENLDERRPTSEAAPPTVPSLVPPLPGPLDPVVEPGTSVPGEQLVRTAPMEIPEPSWIALVAIGLLGMRASRRRTA